MKCAVSDTLAVGILSLGCPRNLVDSESVLGRIKDKGYRVVDIDKADVAIINTCAFIEDAKRESIDALLDAIDFISIVIGSIGIVFVSSYYPARKATQIDVLDVLRNE